MLVYALFWLIIMFLSFKVKKGKFTIYDVFLISIIILFSGLRATGKDYELYNVIFNKFTANKLESRTGIGFDYLIYFIKFYLKFDFQFLIFLFSFLTNLFIYIFIKKNTEKPGLAMLIYISAGFYTTSFNMFRQSLSISLILMASQLIKEKKYFNVVICWFLAFVIHSSSIIAIVIYTLVILFKNKRLLFKYLLPIPIVGLLLYDKLFVYLISLSSTYSMYSTYDSAPGLGTFMNVFTYLFVTIFLIIPKYGKNGQSIELNNLDHEFEKKDYYNYNLFIIGVAIMILELKNFLFFRIAFYFTILGPIMLTSFYEEHNIKNRKLEDLIFYSCLFIYFLVYVSSFDGVLPYKLFFLG